MKKLIILGIGILGLVKMSSLYGAGSYGGSCASKKAIQTSKNSNCRYIKVNNGDWKTTQQPPDYIFYYNGLGYSGSQFAKSPQGCPAMCAKSKPYIKFDANYNNSQNGSWCSYNESHRYDQQVSYCRCCKK